MPDAPARFPCPSCNKSYKWKDSLAGRKVKCTCGHVMVAPLEPPSEDDDLIPFSDAEESPAPSARPVVRPPREDVSASTVHGDQLMASTAFGQAVSDTIRDKPKPRSANKAVTPVKRAVAPTSETKASRSARDSTPVFRPKQDGKPAGSALLKFIPPAIVVALAAAVFVWWKFFRGE